jgi:predicted nucleotide-binding protein
MARKKAVAKPVAIDATLAAEHAAQLLRAHIKRGKQLLESRPISSGSEQAWETVCHDLLIQAFGSTSPSVERVMNVGNFDFAFGGGNEVTWEDARARNLKTRIQILEGLVELLESKASLQAISVGSETNDTKVARESAKVFLVHGHSEAITHAAARFIEKLGIEVIVLREQPNSGRTIIEKFVEFSDVGFAVVPLTADDRGGSASSQNHDWQFRARQNVILELGFFLGKLGRKRVCALYEHGVEIPSDYSGVLFTPLDLANAWHLSLARELKSAGFQVDMNRAI